MNSERKQGSLLCRAGELYNPGKARGISRDATSVYSRQFILSGFLFFGLRVAFAYFKVKKLFVGCICRLKNFCRAAWRGTVRRGLASSCTSFALILM